MAKHSSDIVELAKRGAEARLRELAQEARNLIDLFPHLRDAFDKDELPVSFIIAKGSGQLQPTAGAGGARRRRRASAARRQTSSERMKNYGAARGKAKSNKP